MTSRVEIRQAGRAIEVPEGRTILEVALEQGISYPHGCRSGRCGSCKSRMVLGEVDLLNHTRFALSDKEKEQGLILACRAVPKTDAIVTWLGGDEEARNHAARRLLCRVTAIEDATHDIKQIRLVPEDGQHLAFAAGQYARVTFPGAPTRDYSMANRPGEHELEFHIRRVAGGAATTHIHESVRIGDETIVEGPFGSSYLREKHAGSILCVAGGSGLAPIKSIVETALANGMRQLIHVYLGVRSERDLYLIDHFRYLEGQHSNLAFHPVLSAPTAETNLPTGLVSDALARTLRDFGGWKAYVAGPPKMVEATATVVTASGLRAEDLHADVFFTPDGSDAAQVVGG